MPELPEKPNFKAGKRISAGSLTDIRDMIPRLITGSAHGINVGKAGDRIVITPGGSDSTPESSLLKTFVVMEELDDYLIVAPFEQVVDQVQQYDSDIGDNTATDQWGSDVRNYIAKPYLFQKTPWDGQLVDGDTITYTGIGERTLSQSGNTDITQELYPPYMPGDIIVARYGPTGLTRPVIDTVSDKTPIFWEDINEGGRNWQNTGTTVPFATHFNTGIVSGDPVVDTTATAISLDSADGIQEIYGQKRFSTVNSISFPEAFVQICSNLTSVSAEPSLFLFYATNHGHGPQFGCPNVRLYAGYDNSFKITVEDVGLLSKTYTFALNGDVSLSGGGTLHLGLIPRTVSGSRSSGAALSSLLTVLASLGLITDSTTS